MTYRQALKLTAHASFNYETSQRRKVSLLTIAEFHACFERYNKAKTRRGEASAVRWAKWHFRQIWGDEAPRNLVRGTFDFFDQTNRRRYRERQRRLHRQRRGEVWDI